MAIKTKQADVSLEIEQNKISKRSAFYKIQSVKQQNANVTISQPSVSYSSVPYDPIINVLPPSQNGSKYWMVEQQSGNRFYVRTIGQECELVPPNMEKDYCGHISTNWDGFKGPSGRLVIPSSIRIGGEDYLVTSVGKNAFCLSGDFTKVELPQTIKKIGEGAFCGTNIEVVILPDSVIEIAPLAFHMCSKLHSIQLPTKITLLRHHLLTDTKINELIIPDSVAVIENKFFCRREQYGKLTLRMMGKPPQIEECPFILGGFVQKDVLVPQVFLNHYNNDRFWQTMNLIPY